MKKLQLLVGAAIAVLLSVNGSISAQRLVTPVNEELQPLVSDFFEARVNSPRLVVILSPT